MSVYDVLFEPVAIGPVTAPNRFFQVPHCNGMGHRYPRSLAAMRGVKAEGGWGVIATEEVEIHPTTDISPFNEGRLWDDSDIRGLAMMTEAVHRHGALAAIELIHQGASASNEYSRAPAFAPSHTASFNGHPGQARAMSKRDIAGLRAWHRAAARRSVEAGFDIVYAYAAHNLSVLMHFISRRYNDRSDEYGGRLENRVRLLREVIEDTREAVGHRAAVAVRFAVDELLGERGIVAEAEGRDIIEMLAELPDLWDVNISDWSNDSQTSRFAKEGFQEQYIRFVKSVTTKPVVGVGRFTSPDTMVSQIRRGVLDFIGAARPSIADPFLPEKIRSGRLEDIRECIGCNICVTGDHLCVPMRCTQNPTVGEEWRRGWHPEKVPARHADSRVLVVGAGPAGLECAHILGKRGYQVVVAEKTGAAGGRVTREAALPGLSEWMRVVDYRMNWLKAAANVDIYYDSELDADAVREFGFDNVVVATGSRWSATGSSRYGRRPIEVDDSIVLFTPDHVMDGAEARGPVVVYDADHFYMAGVVAEKLAGDGADVTYVTPAPRVSEWTVNTLEQGRIQARLIGLGIRLELGQRLAGVAGGRARLACEFTGRESTLECATLVMVTERIPNDRLYQALNTDGRHGFAALELIGDAWAPGIIAEAVYSGHRLGRQFGEMTEDPWADFKRDKTAL